MFPSGSYNTYPKRQKSGYNWDITVVSEKDEIVTRTVNKCLIIMIVIYGLQSPQGTLLWRLRTLQWLLETL